MNSETEYNELIDCPNYVYRDFNESNNKQNFKASISIFPIKNTNQLEVQIDGIHDFELDSQDVYKYEYKNKYTTEFKNIKIPQKTILISYSKHTDLYNIIVTILNKITYDDKYLQDLKYQDFILCSNSFAKTHVELCKYDIKQNHARSVWMEFTKKNSQHLHFFIGSRLTSCNGVVDEKYEFVYDFPLNSIHIKQRGRCIWDIIYDYTKNIYKLVNHTNRNILYNNPNYTCPNYVYRNFDCANIEIYVSIKLCKLYILINHMHENEYLDYGGCQAELVVDYSSNISLYDVINTILDKLTYDHCYFLNLASEDSLFTSNTSNVSESTNTSSNTKYTDVIICSNTVVDFTRETVEHIKFDFYDNDLYDDDKHERIILHGKVNENCEFIYDYPIVSNTVDYEYYKATRGHNVWDIEYDDSEEKYIVNKSWRNK